MEKDFYSQLENLLKKDSRFVDQGGDLLKINVIDAAYMGDNKLVELLLSDKIFKTKFFSKVKSPSDPPLRRGEEYWIFNINDFAGYIQDKNFLADSYTKYRNKIGLNIGGKFLNERKEVSLVWPFKDCVLEGGVEKEDEKRHELFFNEILAQDEIDKLLAPKVLTGWKRYTASGEIPLNPPLKKGESPSLSQREAGRDFLRRDENGTIRENLIIKGNNLLALHCLKKQFQNKIKLIYIDPPYNTGNDSFGYNDSFNHSTWLTFMKNRLEVAKVLLRDDGVIFISCDDNEQAYLKVLCDEVFDRGNFIADIIWNSTKSVTNTAIVSVSHTHNLTFAKNKNYYIRNRHEFRLPENGEGFFNPDNDHRGAWKADPFQVGGWRPNQQYEIKNPKTGKIYKPNEGCSWKNDYEKFQELFKDNRIVFGSNGEAGPQRKRFLSEAEERGKVIKTIWDDIDTTTNATISLKELMGNKVFENPKPVNLIKRFCQIGTKKDDIILDFFAGSGTTAQAVLELNKEDGGNRKFILVEQMDYVEKITVERVKKVIEKLAKEENLFSGKEGLNFVYCELMKYNELFVEKIQKAKDAKDVLKIWEEMKEKSFLNYNVDIKKFDEAIDDFKKLPLEKQKRALFDLLNKNQLYVNLSEIEDREFGVGDGDKLANEGFYGK
ncbi:MAG: DNA methyltransferase [bacterium]